MEVFDLPYINYTFSLFIGYQCFFQSFFCLTVYKTAVFISNAAKPYKSIFYAGVVVFLYIRYQIEPYLVPGIKRFLVALVFFWVEFI